MCSSPKEWQSWRRFFERRSQRTLPELDVSEDYSYLPRSLARSLAVFQLGESGGGTIVKQALEAELQGIDEHYAASMALFVQEENRHANLLAMCVRMLGGQLLHKNWTAKLFVVFRRLMGIRLKVLVLLAAEVVGMCYYQLLAARIPNGRVRRILFEIAEDEQAHLWFHCVFLQGQVRSWWRRGVFVAVWRCTMIAAGLAVIIDHRATLRDLGIGKGEVWRRWMFHSELAERLVIGACEVVTYPAHDLS